MNVYCRNGISFDTIFYDLLLCTHINTRIIFRLLREVLECQKSYNNLLKKTLEDQKDQVALLRSTAEQNIAICTDRCSAYRDYSDFDYENGSETNDCSKELIEWLRDVGIDEQSIKKVRWSKFICEWRQNSVKLKQNFFSYSFFIEI